MRDDEAAAMQHLPRSSKTKLYETLGVKKGATDSDLKKAYRKEALRKHPDKGGNQEEFNEMKHAYDVLVDSHKRRVNDWFGDVGVQVLESGSMTMPQFMSIFIGLDVGDRCLILLTLIVCLGYLLLFPILLSIRWDYPNSMSFAHVFIPVWLGLSAILVCTVYTLISPSPFADEEMTEDRETMEHHRKIAGFGSTIFILGLFTLLILLVLRLDGHTDWSFFWVIWPWILVEVLWLVVATQVVLSRKERPLERFLILAASAGPNIFHIIFACNVAWKMDGVRMSWWHVFWPIWASVALGLVIHTCRCMLFVKPDCELSDEEREENRMKKASIHVSIVYLVVCLIFTLLLCYKLAHPKAFPAFVMFLPLFLIVGCACCCLTCFICAPVLMPETDKEDTPIPPRGTTYNTV